MGAEDEILLRFKADLEQMKGDIKKMAHDSDTALKGMAKTTEDTNKKLQGIGDTVKGKMSSAFMSLKGTIAGAFAVHSLIQFTEKLFEMQDALEAIDRKAKAVFKDSLPEMQKEAEKTANAIGLTKHEYLDAAAAATQYLQNTGFSREESAKLAKQLIDTSSKLSLVNTEGLTTKDIMNQLTMSMSGQTRSLKSLGFNIKLTKEEMAQLSEETEGSASATDKKATALKVMNEIMKQSKSVVGDLNDEMFKSEMAERESEAKLSEKMDEIAMKSEALKEAWLNMKIGLLDMFNASVEGFGRMGQDLGYIIGLYDKSAAEQQKFENQVGEARAKREGQAIRETNRLIEFFSLQENQVGREAKINEMREKAEARRLKFQQLADRVGVSNIEKWTKAMDEVRLQEAIITGLQNTQKHFRDEADQKLKESQDVWDSLVEKNKALLEKEQESLSTQEQKNKAVADENALLEKRKQLLEQTSKKVDEVFKERQARNEQAIKDFGAIAEANRAEFDFGTPATPEETPDATNTQLEEQATRVEALQDVYAGLFDSIQEGWLSAVRASGASERQMVILEKSLAAGKILLDYAVARFKIAAQFAVLLANPLTAPTAPAFRTAAISSLNAGLAINLASLAAVAIPQIAFASTKNSFAKGVEFLTGAGTATSDSIPAWLSEGERVVTADKNRKYWDELSAIHNNHFEDLINTKYVVPAIQTMLNETSTGERLAAGIMLQKWKGENIVSELWKSRVADKKNNKELIEAIKPKRQSKRAW